MFQTPAGTRGIRNSPEAPVLDSNSAPVRVLVSFTEASGTRPPVLSVISPLIDATSCARTAPLKRAWMTTSATYRRYDQPPGRRTLRPPTGLFRACCLPASHIVLQSA